MDLYVFGAGASKALNSGDLSYPIGSKLRDEVLGLFEDYLDEARLNRSTPRSQFFIEFIEKYDAQRQGPKTKSVVKEIYGIYRDSTVDTVDEYVAFVRKSGKDYVSLAEAIFQVAVGLVLAFCENPSPRGEDWMRSLLRRYEKSPEGFRVITFNYDRSFQYRYMRWLDATLRTASTSFDVVGSAVHAVYGSLYTNTISIPYGEMKNDIMNIANARQEIGFMRAEDGQNISPKFENVDFDRIEIHGLHPRFENFRWISFGRLNAQVKGELVQSKQIPIICNVYDGIGDPNTFDSRVSNFKEVFKKLQVDLCQVDFIEKPLNEHFK